MLVEFITGHEIANREWAQRPRILIVLKLARVVTYLRAQLPFRRRTPIKTSGENVLRCLGEHVTDERRVGSALERRASKQVCESRAERRKKLPFRRRLNAGRDYQIEISPWSQNAAGRNEAAR